MSSISLVRLFVVPSGFISCAINGLLGWIVYRHNPRHPLNRFFAIFALCTACWSVGSSLENVIPDETLALRVLRGCYVFAAWLPTCFLHLTLVVTGHADRRRAVLRTAYGLSALFAALTFTPWFIPRLRLIEPYGFRISVPGPAYGFFVGFFTLCLVTGLALLFRRIGRTKGAARRQAQYLFIAFLIAFSAGVEYFSRVFRLIEFPPVDDYLLVVYVAVFAYAIVRHRLLDIRIVLSKSLVYSGLIAWITATYLVVVLLIEKLCQGTLGYRAWPTTLLAAFLIAICFNPLRERLQTLVDRALLNATPAELAAQRERLLREIRRSEQQKLVATLASGLAHEIKNPLTAIKAFTECLPQQRADDAFIETFHRIVGGEVTRIQVIVQRLLDFARPSPPQLAMVDVTALLDETLEALSHELASRRIRVERRYAAPRLARADAQQLKQVFLNLLLNSLQAMDGAGGALTLTTMPRQEHLELTIVDTGCGIAPEHLARLGEPFFTTKSHGTGLGLAVVQEIVRQHDGHFAIKSTVGRGTTATIRLRLATS